MSHVEIFNRIDRLMDTYKSTSSFQQQISKERQVKLDTVCAFLMSLADSYPNKGVILNMPELMASIQFLRDEVADEGIKKMDSNFRHYLPSPP